jgi:hypothetical protein
LTRSLDQLPGVPRDAFAMLNSLEAYRLLQNGRRNDAFSRLVNIPGDEVLDMGVLCQAATTGPLPPALLEHLERRLQSSTDVAVWDAALGAFGAAGEGGKVSEWYAGSALAAAGGLAPQLLRAVLLSRSGQLKESLEVLAATPPRISMGGILLEAEVLARPHWWALVGRALPPIPPALLERPVGQPLRPDPWILHERREVLNYLEALRSRNVDRAKACSRRQSWRSPSPVWVLGSLYLSAFRDRAHLSDEHRRLRAICRFKPGLAWCLKEADFVATRVAPHLTNASKDPAHR